MNVHLTPELKKLVEDEVASGLYSSASEVVREGLRLLVEERRWRLEVGRKITEGVAQAKAKELLDGGEVAGRLRKRVKARRKKGA
jgi:antitoxin ParD1/3/4